MFRTRITLIICFCLASTLVHAENFVLSSPTIKPNATLSENQVFNGFGCSGKTKWS